MELHGGSVRAESKGRKEGSTFTVVVPCLQGDEPANAIDSDCPSDPPLRSLKILVADDNADLVNLLIDFLEGMGHKTFAAHNGNDAFLLARNELPEVAILDIGMPEMNGYDLARAIRAEEWGQNIVLIAATGWGNGDDKKREKAAGFTSHLTKPYLLEDLEALLQKMV